MKERLECVLKEAMEEIQAASDLQSLEKIRVKYLGKKGPMVEILKSLGKLPPEEKKELGKLANIAKNNIDSNLEAKKHTIEEQVFLERMQKEKVDVTEPGKKIEIGGLHPITMVIEEVLDIFKAMGYEVKEGPLADTTFNAFDGLNSPVTHPSRDITDTFYLNDSLDKCLRPHTSTVQIRTLKESKPPFKMVSPGRCFRCDTPDATHSPMFHQIEGMIVDEGITMTDLKGTLDRMAKALFGEETRTKFRPHHFPFTEPSAEMDVSCFKCGGKGCSLCKGSGWIEILGCGMIHPNVLAVGNIDTERYTGFAFGMGVERIAMLKYGIEDIRNFYENDMRFLRQFK